MRFLVGSSPMLSAMLAVLKRAAFSYVSKARGVFGACGKLPAVHTFGPVFSKSLNGSLNEFPFCGPFWCIGGYFIEAGVFRASTGRLWASGAVCEGIARNKKTASRRRP